MSKAKHTAGPWSYDGEDIDSEAAQLIAAETGLTHDGYEIFSVDADGDVDEPIGTALNEEDAKLIAAAPDLLAAAQAIRDDIESEVEQRQTSGNDEYWQPLKEKLEKLDAAIIKAIQ